MLQIFWAKWQDKRDPEINGLSLKHDVKVHLKDSKTGDCGKRNAVTEYTVHHSMLHLGLYSCRTVRVLMLTPAHP